MTDVQPLIVKVKLEDSRAQLPQFQTDGAAAADLYAVLAHDQGELRGPEGNQERVLVIPPMGIATIGCGFSMEIPKGFEAQIRARSGLARKGVIIPQGIGTIDSDYRGIVMVCKLNLSGSPLEVRTGDRIAQMVIAAVPAVRYEPAAELSDTARGTGGFGSTGR